MSSNKILWYHFYTNFLTKHDVVFTLSLHFFWIQGTREYLKIAPCLICFEGISWITCAYLNIASSTIYLLFMFDWKLYNEWLPIIVEYFIKLCRSGIKVGILGSLYSCSMPFILNTICMVENCIAYLCPSLRHRKTFQLIIWTRHSPTS